MTYISLSQLNIAVGSLIDGEFSEPLWIVAEINSLQNRGHCYLELVEKSDETDTIVAKASAIIWHNVFVGLAAKFATATATPLRAGISVLVRVRPTFHPLYGYSLNITDIDPSYTIGDVAMRRAAVITRLKTEGVFDCNKELRVPTVIKNVAVISSSGAAGYGDFINQINDNKYGFAYNITLFDAIMQGDNAEESIINALDAVAERAEEFDVVVIVRGGGAVSDLSCYDSYSLAYHITQFPIPVITGIGHNRDVSVADEVSYLNLKTPTAVAAYILDCSIAANDRLNVLAINLAEYVKAYIAQHKSRLDVLSAEIGNSAFRLIENHKHRLDMAQQLLELSSPVHILQKGYTMTLKDGIPVTAEDVKAGDKIETVFKDGTINSIVES